MEFEKVLRERPDGDGLRFLAAQMLGKAGVVLLVDQFEETYAICDDEAERGAFIDNLLNAGGAPNGRVSVVLTLRSDFLGAINHHLELSRMIARQNVVVPVMSEDELRSAIITPAKLTGHAIDPSTVELLIAQTVGREGALPLLEFILTRIWDEFRRGTSAADTVRALGGVGGALAHQAQSVYVSLGSAEQAIARRAFLSMVRLGEGTKDTRRRAPITEMVARGQSERRVLAVLRRFAEPGSRLVSLAGSGETTTSEVAHEALFDHWRLLQEWLDKGRDDLRFERQLNEAATEWRGRNEAEGLLWRPPRLDLLREYEDRHLDEMTQLQEEFARACKSRQLAEEERERQQAAERQRLLERVLRTQSLFLASLSQQETARGDAATGMLLALEALPDGVVAPARRPYVPEAEAALYAAVLAYTRTL